MTGENEVDLRKIIDITRWGAFGFLFLHYYYYCYGFFAQLGCTSVFSDRLLTNITHSGLFKDFNNSKFLALLLLSISLIGAKGKKDDKALVKPVAVLLSAGLTLFFFSYYALQINGSLQLRAGLYMLLATIGFLLVLACGIRLSRILHEKLGRDVFNEQNETFPQEERLLTNPYSVNFTGRYRLAQKQRKGYINVINPFRGIIVCGTPGAGKSWFVILPMIKQMIEKGYALFIYDFKYDDLSRAAYNWMLASQHCYQKPPAFYTINFDQPDSRCNPLDPQNMIDITDASESARTILLGLNREWIKRQGDFFVESPINFVTAIMWYLRKYGNGCFCTLPHVIELMQVKYDQLFPVLSTQPEVQVLMNPFISAYDNEAMEQLEGQIASAKISMARLASPQIYWALSGNDFTLDINDPEHPKIVCVGNNPQKQGIYGAVLSLYISRLVKIVNCKDKQKSALVFDEFPTIYFNNMDALIATARSNKVATVLGMQDFSQLRKDYGKEQADVIVNICGNIISGQVMGDSAKTLADRFGRIVQSRASMSINRTDTSMSHSTQMDYAVPASKISALSSGEFVGMVADNPDEKIKLKMFHTEIVQDSDAINEEMRSFKAIPQVSKVTAQEVSDNYYQVKLDIQNMIEQELYKLNVKEEEVDDY